MGTTVRLEPNPAGPDSGVRFTGLPPDARIVIYHLRGERAAATLRPDARARAVWPADRGRAKGTFLAVVRLPGAAPLIRPIALLD